MMMKSETKSENEPLDPFLLEKVANMHLRTQLIVQSILSGRHHSNSKLGSSEFSEYKKYTPGDDVRRIDWSMYAKTDDLFIKQFHDERALRAFILVDYSASMNYAGPPLTLAKYRYASFLAAALSALLISQNDLVGLIWNLPENDTNDVGLIRPGSGKPHLFKMLHALEEAQPNRTARLETLLCRAAPEIPRRSIVLVISDFLGVGEVEFEVLRGLAMGNNVIAAVQIVDPWEESFPYEGLTTFVDPETGEKMTMTAEEASSNYLKNRGIYQEALIDRFHASRIIDEVIFSNAPLEKSIIGLFEKISQTRSRRV